MSLKLYYDIMSQPCRAIYILLKINNIPYEDCLVALRTGAHLTEEFKRDVSKFSRVPVLHDKDFRLTESVAILRYLSKEKYIPENWYPRDSKGQAKVDEYLEWQHLNTRAFCTTFFRAKWLTPLMTGEPANEAAVNKYQKNMEDCLDSIETLWLSESPYIVGNSLTAADLFAACEIEQTRLAGYDPTKNRPILAAWLKKVQNETKPYYQEAHAILNKIIDKQSKL